MGLMGMDGNGVDKISWFLIGCIGVCRHKWLLYLGFYVGTPIIPSGYCTIVNTQYF